MNSGGLKDIKEYKRLLDEELKKIEERIYEDEAKYLEETAPYGISPYGKLK